MATTPTTRQTRPTTGLVPAAEPRPPGVDPALDPARQEALRRLFLAARDDPALYARLTFGLTPAWHHRRWLERIALALAEDAPPARRRAVIVAPPGSAKALALDTLLPTPTGWTTMGEVWPGDRLLDEQGRPCTVTAVSEVFRDRPVYAVRTDDGDELVADAEHLWRAQLARGAAPGASVAQRKKKGQGAFGIHTTAVLARKRGKRARIERAKALELPEAALPVDPYVLGVWLGDGTTAAGSVTSGDEDRAWLRTEIERCGYPTVDRPSTPITFRVAGLTVALRRLGLLWTEVRPHRPPTARHVTRGRKHIPDAYLRASAAQRLALLQGIVDTDGTVAPFGEVTVSVTNAELALGIRELVRTLGVKAGMTVSRAILRGKDCGPAYRIRFFMAEAARMPRKRARCKDGTRTPDAYVEAVPCGRADTRCVAVDSPSHLYLAGESMLPTHNTTVVSQWVPCHYLGRHPDRSLLVVTASDAMARQHTLVAGQVLAESAAHARVFPAPMARPAPQKGWSADGLYLRGTPGKDPAYRAVGLGAHVLGSRCHVLVLDDCVTQEQAQSALEMDRARRFLDQTLLSRLHPPPTGGVVLAVGTRWSEGDLIAHLEGLGFETLHFPQLSAAYWTDGQEGPDEAAAGTAGWRSGCSTSSGCTASRPPVERDAEGRAPLWPGRYPLAWVQAEQARLGSAQFELLHQGNPTLMGGAVWRSAAWFKPLPASYHQLTAGGPPFADACVRCTYVDTAWSSRETADYTAAVTVAYHPQDPARALYVVGLWRRRIDQDGLAEALAEHLAAVRPHAVGVEQAAYKQAATAELLQQVRYRLNNQLATYLVAVPSVQDKVTRARPAAAKGEAGLLYVDKTLEVYPVLEREALALPLGEHDDLADALSGAAAMGIYGVEALTRGQLTNQRPVPLRFTGYGRG